MAVQSGADGDRSPDIVSLTKAVTELGVDYGTAWQGLSEVMGESRSHQLFLGRKLYDRLGRHLARVRKTPTVSGTGLQLVLDADTRRSLRELLSRAHAVRPDGVDPALWAAFASGRLEAIPLKDLRLIFCWYPHVRRLLKL